MASTRPILIRLYWLATAALFVVALVVLFQFTPTERTMGLVQKIFYLHFPVAINALLACAVSFVGCVGYLATRRRKWDDLAAAAATVAVLLLSVVLITGMIWAKHAWGQWWTWSPRLTFSLLLWLLYASYLVVRASIDSPSRRALVCAVYGVVAFIDVPLVYFSVRLMEDMHPTSISLEPAMWLTVALFALPVIMLTAGFIAAHYRLARLRCESDQRRQDASDRPQQRTDSTILARGAL